MIGGLGSCTGDEGMIDVDRDNELLLLLLLLHVFICDGNSTPLATVGWNEAERRGFVDRPIASALIALLVLSGQDRAFSSILVALATRSTSSSSQLESASSSAIENCPPKHAPSPT